MAIPLTLSGVSVDSVSTGNYTSGNTSEWHFPTSTSGTANWRYVYLEQPKTEVTVHYDWKIEEVKEEMAGLYRVVAVDYKNRKVVVDKELIADNEADALLWGLGDIVLQYDPKDLDKKAIKVMDVRRVPEPQKVQVVKEESPH